MAFVHAATDTEAIQKADDEELVDKSWEMPDAVCMGEDLPEVFA